jgi:Mor family transcriptional regulator
MTYRVIFDAIMGEAMRRGISTERASQIAMSTTERLRVHLGGQTVYYQRRKDPFISIADRDRLIRERWNGRNTEELARQFGLSIKRVRRIGAG